MLRFIICEDNKDFRERVSNNLTKIMMSYSFEYKISKFSEYNKEVEKIILNKFEKKIYILDIELPEVSGLEIASSIRNIDLDSTIIFLTSHPECQNDIFHSRLLALDYINKNQVWTDRFEKTVCHAIKNLNKGQVLAFEFNHNSYRLLTKEIMYIEKIPDNQKCKIYMEDGFSYEIMSSISDLFKQLGSNFFKTHKSYLVNVDKIRSVDYSENLVTFVNGESVYLLSNRNKKGLKEYIANY